MGGYTIYLLGFRENDLNEGEEGSLDSHISKWSSGWSITPYSPLDKRKCAFDNISKTFAGEGPRPDGKRIVIYQEIIMEPDKDKTRFFEAFQDIKATFPDILFEAHDEKGRLG